MLKSIFYLFLLVLKLGLIADMHQLASTANPEIAAQRIGTVRRRLKHFNHKSLDIALPYFFNLGRYQVADRKHPADHYPHAIVKPPETLILLRLISYPQLYNIISLQFRLFRDLHNTLYLYALSSFSPKGLSNPHSIQFRQVLK